MSEFNQEEFKQKLLEKTDGNIRKCPFCGGDQFSTTENHAAIVIGKELENITLGPYIPSGILVCQNCGHIDLFALGSLGMLPKKDGETYDK